MEIALLDLEAFKNCSFQKISPFNKKMDPLSPVMQYGPDDGGYATALRIGLVVIGILVGSWLFGAAYALIVNYSKGKKDKDS